MGSVLRTSCRGVVRAVAIILSAGLVSCGSAAPNDPPPPTTTPPATTPVTTLPAAPRLGSLSCDRIGEGRDLNNRCAKESPTFLAQLDRSIDEIVAEQPGLFNLDDQVGAGGYRVKSTGQFLVALIDKMDKKSLCAAFDGEEIQVKNTNEFNDQYHVITSNGHLRRGDASYRATCYPAAFPTFRPLPGAVAGCSLPPSREITCGREDESQFLHLVDAAIDKVGQTHPEVFDKNDTQAGTDWWKIVDHDRFVTYLVEALRPSGFCAFFDGEELEVKNTNKAAELFDITTSASYVRRGEGSYRSTCYPASF